MLESAYLSRRLDLHPGNLAEAAGYWHRALRPLRWDPRLVRVSYGFWLDSTLLSGTPTPYDCTTSVASCGPVVDPFL